MVAVRYLVVTVSGSRYLLDLNRSTMRRIAAMDMSMDRSLRRDGQLVDLVSVVDCTVGRRMQLVIDLHLPGVINTSRQTTDVESIRVLVGQDDDLKTLLA